MRDQNADVVMLSALVWKYGDVFIDDGEIETHIVSISAEEVMNFGFQTLEIYHNEEERKTYYRVRKIG